LEGSGGKKEEASKKQSEEQIEEEHEDEDGGSSDKKGDSSKGGAKGQQDNRNEFAKFLFDQNNNPKPEGFVSLLVAGLALYYVLTYKKPMQELVYKDFLNDHLLKSNIKEITITKDKRSEVFNYRAEITTISGEKYYMTLGSYESFLAKLDLVQREMGKQPHEFVPVKYTNQSEEQMGNYLLNLLIAGLVVVFFAQIYKNRNKGSGTGTGGKGGSPNKGGQEGGGWFNQKGGMGDIFNYGKSNATVYGDEKKIKVKFSNVAGNENAKVEIMEFVDFLKDPKKYQKLGARVPRGALLVGPPGCGKTMLAKAVAGESKVPFFSISGSDFVEMFVGVGASRVRDLFKKARQRAPAIIFIDEIDAVGKKRHGKMGGGNDERDNTLNQLLVEMDGFTTDTSVIVLAATNRKDMLDSALLRPGRFDRTIEITLPSIKEREQIFNVHLKKIKLNPKLEKEDYARKLSALTPGFSGADIKNICNEAAIIAARKNIDSVSIKEFEEATERVIAGIEKKLPLSDFERRTVAFHEAGHAVAGWFLEHSSPLLKITIVPRAKGSLGFA
jgi:AFG3 family protein